MFSNLIVIYLSRKVSKPLEMLDSEETGNWNTQRKTSRRDLSEKGGDQQQTKPTTVTLLKD